MYISLFGWLGVLAFSALAALVILLVIGLVLPALKQYGSQHPSAAHCHARFLFEDQALCDHDTIGPLPLRDALDDMEDWTAFRNWLSSRFESLPSRLPGNGNQRELVFRTGSPSDPATLTITPLGTTTHVTLSDPAQSGAAERHAMIAATAELADRNTLLQAAPFPIWTSETTGSTIWQNDSAAASLPDRIRQDTKRHDPPDAGQFTTRRIEIDGHNGNDTRCFEISTIADGTRDMHFASDITEVHRAERVRREFVQTLTKTFANLPTGLAIFDRGLQLALFNPALIDLTGLSAEFLSARPQLMPFFDELRNRRVLPEPKSYSDWRAQITEVVEQASGGLYQEIWALPSGMTYRVTGRPHPDGAVAFLFEDISTEMTHTRRFRSQVDLRQSVLDGLTDAIVVIAPDRSLLLCNRAFTQLTGIDPGSSLAEMRLRDMIAQCKSRIPDAAAWDEVDDRLHANGLGQPVNMMLTTVSGTLTELCLLPLPGGHAMLFLRSQAGAAIARPEPESMAP